MLRPEPRGGPEAAEISRCSGWLRAANYAAMQSSSYSAGRRKKGEGHESTCAISAHFRSLAGICCARFDWARRTNSVCHAVRFLGCDHRLCNPRRRRRDENLAVPTRSVADHRFFCNNGARQVTILQRRRDRRSPCLH